MRDEFDGFKAFAAAVLVLLALVGAWLAHLALYPIAQAQAVYERTLDADNAIYNYEWFHTRAEDFDAAVEQAAMKDRDYRAFLASAGPRERWNLDTAREARQLDVERAGLAAQVVAIAHEYNAHVGMANRDLFRSHDLPARLTPPTRPGEN